MTDLRTAAQQALDFIRAMNSHGWLLADYESDMERTVAGLEAALAQEQAEHPVDLPALCGAIAKHLGESWLVVGPDGSRFVAQSPLRAANAANKHFCRLHHDPEKAAKFDAMINKVRQDSERENDRLLAMYGSLNCPTCGGSGHIGDAALAQEQAEPAQEPVGTVRVDAGEVHIVPRIRDADRSALKDGQPVYTAPPQRKPLSADETHEVGG